MVLQKIWQAQIVQMKVTATLHQVTHENHLHMTIMQAVFQPPLETINKLHLENFQQT